MNYYEFWETRLKDNRFKNVHSKTRLENILYYYALESHARLDAPTIVGLDVTSRCNLRCKHCFQNERIIPNELTTSEWINVINELKNMKVYQIYIMGGEPFMRADLLQILEAVKNAGMTLSINTNATLITPRIAERLSRILDPRTDYIQISLDGASREINDDIRGTGQFDIAIRQIKLLKENKISVRVNTVINNSNFCEMTELYELCSNLKVDRLALTTIYPYKRESLLSVPEDNACISEFNRMLQRASELNFPVIIDQDPICVPYRLDYFQPYLKTSFSRAPMLVCRAGLYSCEIDPTGDVFPCTFMHYEKYKAGNIRKTSFKEIWKDDRNWTTIIDKVQTLNATCKSCSYVEKCKGGCIAAGLDTGHGIGGGDPRCIEIQKDLFKEF